MFPKGSLSYRLLLFFKGTIMGVANKVPGVSGGAVAYVLDFYNELIYSFQKINGKAFMLLINGRFKSLYNYINATFLIYIVGGMIFSYFTVSKILDYFLQHNELQVWSLFFGMIIGSSIYLIKRYKEWELKSYVSLFFGVAVGIAITFIHPVGENDNLWFVFLCGVIGVSGMTIPGLSGSYILMLLGNYVFLLVDSVNVLNHVLVKLFTGNTTAFFDLYYQRYLIVISVFMFGSLFGLIFLSQILGFVLEKWGKIVNAVIIGFILGSLGTVWPWKEKIYEQNNNVSLTGHFNRKIVVGFHKCFPDFSTQQTWGTLFFVLIGVLLVLGVERFSNTNKLNE